MFDGFIGLAPYSNKDVQHHDKNFMYQLKKNNRIDHNVAAIYTDLDPNNLELPPMIVVKFGGWDSFALAPNENLHVHRTNINTQWSWNTDTHKYISGSVSRDLNLGVRKIQVNPSVPYIYMAPHDLFLLY